MTGNISLNSNQVLYAQIAENPSPKVASDQGVGNRVRKVALIALAIVTAAVGLSAFVWTTLEMAICIAIPAFLTTGIILWSLCRSSQQVETEVYSQKPMMTFKAGAEKLQKTMAHILSALRDNNPHCEKIQTWSEAAQKEIHYLINTDPEQYDDSKLSTLFGTIPHEVGNNTRLKEALDEFRESTVTLYCRCVEKCFIDQTRPHINQLLLNLQDPEIKQCRSWIHQLILQIKIYEDNPQTDKANLTLLFSWKPHTRASQELVDMIEEFRSNPNSLGKLKDILYTQRDWFLSKECLTQNVYNTFFITDKREVRNWLARFRCETKYFKVGSTYFSENIENWPTYEILFGKIPDFLPKEPYIRAALKTFHKATMENYKRRMTILKAAKNTQ